jgi:enterochelin esterase-like enzyme
VGRAWPANWIFDNLIAAGKAKPMVVVMLDGHSSGAYQRQDFKSVEPFSRELLEDALPLVEKNYRLAEGRRTRAIVGLSMGARQSVTVGLEHLDLFGWVAGSAPSTTLARTRSGPCLRLRKRQTEAEAAVAGLGQRRRARRQSGHPVRQRAGESRNQAPVEGDGGRTRLAGLDRLLD